MKQLYITLILLFSFYCTNTTAQSSVFAGKPISVSYGSTVNLNAMPLNKGTWDTIPGYFEHSIKKLSFANDTTVFAITTSGGLLKSTDGGETWSAKNYSHPFEISSIAFYDHLRGIACHTNSSIYKTNDGGETWTKTFDGGNYRFNSIKYQSETTILVAENSNLVRSYDGGTTWTLSENPSIIRGVYYLTENINGDMFAMFTTGRIAKINNYKINTSDLRMGVPGLRAACFLNEHMAISAHNQLIQYIYYDSHMGEILGIQSSLPGMLYEETKDENGNTVIVNQIKYAELGIKGMRFMGAKIGYIVGNTDKDAFILKTTDGGLNWKIDKSFVNKKINDLDIYNTSIVVAGDNFVARYVYEKSENDSYSWWPTTGLSNSNIKNPILNAHSSDFYVVKRINGTEISRDTLQVNVESLKFKSVGDNAIGCTGSVPLEYMRTNYMGNDSFTYKWTPATGLSADNIPNPVFTDNQTTMALGDTVRYNLTVTDRWGTSISKEVKIARDPLKISTINSRAFVCGTSSLGNILGPIYSNYTGAQPLRYKWTIGGQEVSTEASIEIAAPTQNTVYTVEVSTAEGCSKTATVNINVQQPSVYLGADKSIICGSSVIFDQPSTNMSSTEKLSYKWTPATGLSSDTIARPTASPAATTTYTLVVSSKAGCTATNALVVTVNPFSIDAGPDKTTNCSTPVELGPVSFSNNSGQAVRYKWTPAAGLSNDTIANPMATPSATTEYTLTITNANGCSATDKVKVELTAEAKPQIDFVSVTETSNNIINWTKSTNTNLVAYNVYRETNVSNTYEKIAHLLDSSTEFFIDTLSNSAIQSNSYKISSVDICNNETSLSDKHKTMHLAINKGANGAWNLIWEQYQGFSVASYNIYRGSTKNDIRQVGSISGNNNQFSDFTANSEYVYYQIEAVATSASGVSQSIKSAANNFKTSTIISSRSNMATNKSDVNALNQLKDLSAAMVLYPNPAANKFYITLNAPIEQNVNIKIYDITGALVLSDLMHSNKQMIDLSEQASGLYFVSIESDNFSAKQKIIINRSSKF